MSSLANVRMALEAQLDASVNITVAYENAQFAPVSGIPYAAPYLLPAQPDNPEMGSGYTEQGIFQVSLFYPLNQGAGAAQAMAETIRAAFPVAASFTANGTVTNITSTPEIAPARAEDDFFMVPVRVRWSAQVGL